MRVHQPDFVRLVDDALRPCAVPVVFPGHRSDLLAREPYASSRKLFCSSVSVKSIIGSRSPLRRATRRGRRLSVHCLWLYETTAQERKKRGIGCPSCRHGGVRPQGLRRSRASSVTSSTSMSSASAIGFMPPGFLFRTVARQYKNTHQFRRCVICVICLCHHRMRGHLLRRYANGLKYPARERYARLSRRRERLGIHLIGQVQCAGGRRQPPPATRKISRTFPLRVVAHARPQDEPALVASPPTLRRTWDGETSASRSPHTTETRPEYLTRRR